MLTVRKLIEALEGLDPDAQVVVGIVEGPEFNAVYADQQVCAVADVDREQRLTIRAESALGLYICCYQQPRPFDWGDAEPQLKEDGTGSVRYDPEDEKKNGGAA